MLLSERYKIIQALESGGMSQTYIAEDIQRPGSPKCVVKQLKPPSGNNAFLPIVHRLFNQEADILERLGGHSQIPRLLAYVSQGQEFYLVQEYIDGHTLAAELPRGLRLSESQVIQLLVEILEILAFVHDQGVIHRDIKPENLIRRRSDGKLVLIDFGAVKQVQFPEMVRSAQMNRTAPIGTPGYMPTEQATGNPHLSSDLFAVGVIGVQALTGLHPQKLQRDIDGELIWQDKADVGPGLTEFLQKMTHPYFHRRYRTAREALQGLQQLERFKPGSILTIPQVTTALQTTTLSLGRDFNPTPLVSGVLTVVAVASFMVGFHIASSQTLTLGEKSSVPPVGMATTTQ
ncbi:MAG: serine/threonine-protein kinase [Leptolyngbyaceae cyanobacterium MO_188.B28]|nr:serine/threonine-protein kinase [Leptolyngbyaceae cyanobacterium MO_188.B28]